MPRDVSSSKFPVGSSHRIKSTSLAIARAIANDASIIVADEPTGNLDKENEQKVMEYFQYLSSIGKSIVMVTHNENLLEYSDKAFYLRNGKLEEFIL